MSVITVFEIGFTSSLPETAQLLASSNLVLHPLVYCLSLHGSRGQAGSARPDSDIDMCLHVDIDHIMPPEVLDSTLRKVLETSLSNWRGPVEIDLAAVYPLREGGLDYFESTKFEPQRFPPTAAGHFALFKVQKWFNGFVNGEEVQIEKMYPCTVIWRKLQN